MTSGLIDESVDRSRAQYLGDPITREVVRNSLNSLANEMAVVVVRTAHSQIVRDSMDFSTAIFDADGRVIAQGLAIPLHLGAMPDAIAELQRRYLGNIAPGDVFILNDPDEGGMHLPDIFLYQPLFHEGRVFAWVACVAHHADVGGRVAGSNAVDSTEIYQEGLQIPILKYYEQGVLNSTLAAIIARNVRLPGIVRGDIGAQMSALAAGERGLRKLIREYDGATLRTIFDEILSYTEVRVRSEISSIPDGRYTFEDYIDDDGFGSDTITIRVTVTIEGDRMSVDFAGTSPQVRSALNATTSFTKAAVYTAFLCAASSNDALSNDGLYRAIDITVPSGTILNPRRPAPRAARGLTGYRVIDAVMGALHQAIPERTLAAGEGGATMISLGMVDEDGTSHVLVDFVCGGWGARSHSDGLDGASSIGANLANVPVEQIELEYPVMVEEYGFIPDSAGPGKYRGCLATVRQLRFLGDSAVLAIRSDRRDHPPYGLAGGKAGDPSLNVLNPGTEHEEVLPTKVTRTICYGDVIRHQTAGGGGYGPPLERSIDALGRDVTDQKLTALHIAEHYPGHQVDGAESRR